MCVHDPGARVRVRPRLKVWTMLEWVAPRTGRAPSAMSAERSERRAQRAPSAASAQVRSCGVRPQGAATGCGHCTRRSLRSPRAALAARCARRSLRSPLAALAARCAGSLGPCAGACVGFDVPVRGRVCGLRCAHVDRGRWSPQHRGLRGPLTGSSQPAARAGPSPRAHAQSATR